MKSDNIIFFQRTFPSANMVLIKDRQTILVDTGYGSDINETKILIESEGIQLSDIDLIVNTHYHSDHVGGNHYFQKHYGIEIAAHHWEGQLVNRLDRETGASLYLDQAIEKYRVNHMLKEGDEINSGEESFRVIHTPGHTLGHISLYNEAKEILIVGDLFHSDDVGWLNIFREGVSAVNRSIESLEKLAKLNIQVAYSGHGAQLDNPQQVIERAIERFKRWANNQESIGWHACKRIYAFTLIIKNGMHKDKVEPYLLSCPWFHDYARHIFCVKPKDFIHELLHEMIRSEAAVWKGDKLMATAPYDPADPSWQGSHIRPTDWRL